MYEKIEYMKYSTTSHARKIEYMKCLRSPFFEHNVIHSQTMKYVTFVIDCTKITIKVMIASSKLALIGIILIPLITAYLNIHINEKLISDNHDIIYIIIIKGMYDYISWILRDNYIFSSSQITQQKLTLRLNMAKLKCASSIPGVNQKSYEDLLKNNYKLNQFLFVAPILCSSLISFTVTIYRMEYYYGLLFTVLCIILLCVMIYLTDATLYISTIPNNTTITEFSDTDQVKIKLSMSCTLDTKHEINKTNKQNAQQNKQKYILCILNATITFISLYTEQKSLIHSFGSNIWMISCLADNIKSLQYKDYMIDFMKLCETLEKHCHITIKPIRRITNLKTISFRSTYFGYYNDDLTKDPKCIPIINNLTYTFNRGILYYLEAPNGLGKSTLLRMFQSNLISGDVSYNNINRNNITFEDLSTHIFYVTQASEYTPKFTKDEIKLYHGRDVKLEQQLGLQTLFGKDTIEMSGGQKKRMLIYIALTSSAPLILFDEVLSELSTEDTHEVKEGGGWLSRVINTIINWSGRRNKIIILVGHGLVNLIPQQHDVIKLSFSNIVGNTVLTSRK
jgi:ABC-type cobalamin/Fe3+-siderophores transport system ATPase subunit